MYTNVCKCMQTYAPQHSLTHACRFLIGARGPELLRGSVQQPLPSYHVTFYSLHRIPFLVSFAISLTGSAELPQCGLRRYHWNGLAGQRLQH